MESELMMDPAPKSAWDVVEEGMRAMRPRLLDRPRLVLQIVDAPNLPGGKLLMLCTEDGQPFGMQIACSVECEADALSTVTVKMHIDGEAIRFAD